MLRKQFQKVGYAIWLPEKRQGAGTGEHLSNLLLCVGAGEDHQQIGPNAFGLAQHLGARDHRQCDVQEHRSEVVRGGSQHFDSLGSPGGLQHREALLAEHPANGEPEDLFVFHDKNGPATCTADLPNRGDAFLTLSRGSLATLTA